MVKRKPGRLFPLEVEILQAGLTVQAEEQSFYGFALVRRMAEQNGGRQVAHGTLYKALGRLASGGLLEASWEDPAVAEAAARPRRRLYRVTGAGEAALHSERELACLPGPGLRRAPGAAGEAATP